MLGLSAIAYPLGSMALTGVSLWFKSDLSEFGFGVGTNLVSSLLAAAPDWLRSQFPRRPGQPNHDLAHAFHQALNETLVHACEGRPIKRFKDECPEAWGALHQGLRNGINEWFTDLAKAAADKSKAGTAPLVPLDDAFLKELLEDNGDTALSRLHALLHQDLQQRLSMQGTSPSTEAVLDDDALKALAQFADWLCRHLDAQVQLFFLEQLKPTTKGPSPAWISYQFLLGQAMQKHLGEIADHAVETRQAINEIIALLKSSQGLPSLAGWPQEEMARLEKRIIEEIKALGTSIESLKRQMHQRFDALPTGVVDELERRRLLKPHFEFKADISRIDKYAPTELIGREDELKLLHDAWASNPKSEIPNSKSVKVLTFVALGGEGKTSLVAKWTADLAHRDWQGCDGAFAWSFYSQGTRDQVAASSDLFLKEALNFFGNDDDKAFAASPAGAHEKGQRLARIVGQRRCLLILDGLEPLQYAPTSPTPGELKDQGIIALLKGLATNSHGLCVVTTRYSIPNLNAYRQTTAPEVPLLRLSREAGVHLLQSFGIKGSLLHNLDHGSSKEKLNEFEKLVEDVKGHALTLNLLGTYLRDAHGGDIRRRDLIKFDEADSESEHPNHAAHVMDAYVQWFATGGKTEEENKKGLRALALLRLLGLFDRPATADCLTALWTGDAIPQLTEPLAGLNDAQRNIALTRLENAKLLTVSRDASGALVSLDAHPHLREYFAKQLRERYSEAWRAAHRRLYEYLCESTKEGEEPTLEDLQPLYQAVAHGCLAGLQQEAHDNVHLRRIRRNRKDYCLKKLGAFGTDLGAMACFFEKPWSKPSPILREIDQVILLGNAAFRLRALGRLKESIEPLAEANMQIIKLEEWAHAAAGASNLSELELTLGAVVDATRNAKQSVTYADRSYDAAQAIMNRATHANALHKAGLLAEAEALFREAEQMQAENQPVYPLLYSFQGFQYCDLLLAASERAAWQAAVAGLFEAEAAGMSRSDRVRSETGPTSSLMEREPIRSKVEASDCRAALDAVFLRTTQTLKWAERNKASLLTIALDHLTLARTALFAAILDRSEIHIPQSEIDLAVSSLRRAGTKELLPHSLLTRAWQRTLTGALAGLESAHEDLEEAWEIAERGPMPLFMADIHLHRARLFGHLHSNGGEEKTGPQSEAEKAKVSSSNRTSTYPWQSPQADLAEARRLIEKHGYWCRKEELEDAEAVFGRLG